MPEYLFRCDKCEHEFSITCPMNKLEDCKKCEKCKSKKIHRRYDEELGSNCAHVPKTLGMFLDKQDNKMSKEAKKAFLEKARET